MKSAKKMGDERERQHHAHMLCMVEMKNRQWRVEYCYILLSQKSIIISFFHALWNSTAHLQYFWEEIQANYAAFSSVLCAMFQKTRRDMQKPKKIETEKEEMVLCWCMASLLPLFLVFLHQKKSPRIIIYTYASIPICSILSGL